MVPIAADDLMQRVDVDPQVDVPAIIARALDHVRAGQADDAIACLQSQHGAALEDHVACNLLGLIQASIGKQREALASFDQALAMNPGSVDLLINRAVTLQGLGELELALEAHEAVLCLRPSDPETLYNRGAALHLLGRVDEALSAYEKALWARPAYPQALAGRGVVLQQQGDLAGALHSYDRALAITPADAHTLYNRGNVLRAMGRNDEALASHRDALRHKPDHAEALCGCAIILNEMGRHDEAITCCAEALRHTPGHFAALFNRANILYATGRIAEARADYDAAVSIAPSDPDLLHNRAAALFELALFEEALVSCDEALRLRPDFPEARSNRGHILQKLQRFEEALVSYDEALRLRPGYIEARCGRGVVLRQLERFEEALASFDAALALAPDNPHTLNNRGALMLLMGDFARGWDAYESRWLKENLPINALPRTWPEWTGSPLQGKRILVLDEQGLGDVIQFARYLPLLAERGGKVTFHCRQNMHRLLGSLQGAIDLVAQPGRDDSFDFEIPLVSLPRAFGTDLASIPTPKAYLRAEDALIAAWADRIGSSGFRIGICWQGNPNPKADTARAVPLSSFAPLAAIKGVRLISLQKNIGIEQLAALPKSMQVETLGDDFDSGPDAFIDTAAVMANLDLVITCDTSIAHLAGALGKPVWVALKRVPDWRFLLNRPDMPWYPTMRLFRQGQRGEWNDVFGRIAAELRELVAVPEGGTAAMIHIPGSIGELIDKITILEIKSERISDAAKLANVNRELGLLRRLRVDAALAGVDLDALAKCLKQTNLDLWKIEDDIRNCEQRADFGPAFVALARAVYKTNDRRAALKRDINLLFDSAIVEEKSYQGGEPG